MSKPLPQRIVPFYSDELIAVQRSDGVIFVLFTRLCDNLKLPRWTQSRRVQNHAVLSAGLVTLTIETPGGPQEAQCLRIDLLPLWLAGVSARKADAAVKEKLILYQTEAAQVFWREFKPQIINEPDHDLAPSTDNELAQLAHIAELGRAITRMAEEQFEMRRRVDAAARAFKTIRHDLSDVQVRLGVLEDKLHPASYITDAQATRFPTSSRRWPNY
ncbi:MAG: hypothetical protein HC828_12020 [Blastochloris sp.]|nr:hypothetical protein [Blastochloris sp.]